MRHAANTFTTKGSLLSHPSLRHRKQQKQTSKAAQQRLGNGSHSPTRSSEASSSSKGADQHTRPPARQGRQDTAFMFRRVSSSREAPLLEKVTEGGSSSGGGSLDKRAIGAFVLELSLTVVGYYILYHSAKSLIGMMDPTKKDKDSVAQVRVQMAGRCRGLKVPLVWRRCRAGADLPLPLCASMPRGLATCVLVIIRRAKRHT